MKGKKERSIFATALTGLLDETELFERADWADLLGVTESAISQWVSDKTIPHPDHLYVLFATLKGSDIPSEEPLNYFRQIAQLQATEVSPNGRRMLPNVWTYMTRPAFGDLSRKLVKLSPSEQEELLESLFLKVPKPDSESPMLQTEASRNAPVSATKVERDEGAFPGRQYQYGRVFHDVGVKCLHSAVDATCTEEVITSFDEQRFLSPTLKRVVDPLGQGENKSVQVSLDELLGMRQVAIIGQPGAGKSMLLSHIARQLAEAHVRQRNIYFPVYAHLPCLSAGWSTKGREEVFHSLISANNESSHPVLIVDGLDEAPQKERANLIREISRFIDPSQEVGLVVSSRPMNDLKILTGLTYVEIQPLSDFALNSWIFGRLSEPSPKSPEFTQSEIHTFIAHLSERPAVLNALRNPLFLSVSGSLFRRNAITAFYETDILNECLWLLLDEWERRKKVVRLHDTWARPQRLYSFLSDLSYQCLRSKSFQFTTAQVTSWTKNLSYEAPVESMLSLLSEITGLVQRSSEEHWQFTHSLFQEYLAARYAVESSRNTVEILGEKLTGEGWQNAFRLACSITNDASPLIRFVLRDANLTESDQSVLLADIIAQDITAERDLIEASCDRVVNWLGKSFSRYVVQPQGECYPDDLSRILWQLSAKNTKSSSTLDTANGKRARRVLHTLHRARSSPVRNSLIGKLATSSSGVVREFSKCIEVEGKYADRIEQNTDGEWFSAQVHEVAAVM